jgi:hypothetical protein
MMPNSAPVLRVPREVIYTILGVKAMIPIPRALTLQNARRQRKSCVGYMVRDHDALMLGFRRGTVVLAC